jgi:hypothetical protein
MLSIDYIKGHKEIIYYPKKGPKKIIFRDKLSLNNPYLCGKWHIYCVSDDYKTITKYNIKSMKIIKSYKLSEVLASNTGTISFKINDTKYIHSCWKFSKNRIYVSAIGKYFLIYLGPENFSQKIIFSCTKPYILLDKYKESTDNIKCL